MTKTEDSRLEALSALVDDALPAAGRGRVLDELGKDPELRKQWLRYHLIGAAMRADALAAPALAKDVRDQVSDEPIPNSTARARRAGIRPITGFAIAASVAAVAVLGLRLFLSPVAESGVGAGGMALAPVTGAVAVTRQVEIAVAAAPGVQSVANDAVNVLLQPSSSRLRTVAAGTNHAATQLLWHDLRPGVEARLNTYLVNHTESLGNRMRGMLPYAALVGYESK